MEKQFKTAEEQLEHIRRLDRERQKRSALAGNRNMKMMINFLLYLRNLIARFRR